MTNPRTAAAATARFGVIAAGALVVVFVGSALARTPGAFLPWADTWVTIAVYAMCGASLVAVARATRNPGWLAIAVAMLFYGAGDVTWAITGEASARVFGVQLFDWFWLAYYPVAFIGIRWLAPVSRRDAVDLLDSVVVGAGTFITASGLTVLVFDQLPAVKNVSIVNVVFVVGDLMILALLAVLLLRHRLQVPLSWWVLAAGLGLFAAADIIYWAQEALETYVEGSVLDALWLLGAFGHAAAGALALRGTALADTSRRLGSWAPSLSLVLAGLALLRSPNGPFSTIVKTAAVVALGAAIVRLNLAIREARNTAELKRRVYTDDLTGLPNRQYLLHVNAATGVQLPKSGNGWSLLAIGLDRFRDVNATLGHDGGDRVLTEVAERLQESLRGTDVLVRLDGDEFAVLLTTSDQAAVLDTAERLLTQLQTPVVVDGIAVTLTACVGVCSDLGEAPDTRMLLRNADEAMEAAKADGPGLVRAFSGRSSDNSATRLQMRSDLRYALTHEPQQFRLRYQPIMNTASGTVFASEALVRWYYTDRWLSPGEFLPEVQFAGLMPQLTRVVLHRALTDVALLGPAQAVTVNVSPDLVSPWLTQTVAELLEETGAAANSLIIEITEEALLRNPDDANAVIGDLRARGVSVLLDDFGSGWCGLSAVRDLAIDGLKIDRSFVSRLGADAPTRAITGAIAGMSRDLGLIVIGEGAEDEDEVRALQELGVFLIQGYALHRPMPFTALQDAITATSRA